MPGVFWFGDEVGARGLGVMFISLAVDGISGRRFWFLPFTPAAKIAVT